MESIFLLICDTYRILLLFLTQRVGIEAPKIPFLTYILIFACAENSCLLYAEPKFFITTVDLDQISQRGNKMNAVITCTHKILKIIYKLGLLANPIERKSVRTETIALAPKLKDYQFPANTRIAYVSYFIFVSSDTQLK